MKLLFLLIAFQCCLTAALAQIIRLQTQAEVDNFSQFYAAQLVIGPDTCCSDIHDLSPLANVWGTEIGIVVKNNPHLLSLHGLEQINYMKNGGQIRIINNDSLPNLTGLADSIGYFPPSSGKMVGYVIEGNDRLVDLQGIPDCSEAALKIRGNAVLSSLNGCQPLNYLYTVTIENCPNLQSFQGLQGVDTLYSSLFLQYCPRLKNMHGLANCRMIGFQLYCHRLDSLENTDGLGNLRTTDNLLFDSCARFRALTDLERLGKNKFGDPIADLEVSYCPWFGDFSGLSDTACFRKANFYHVDSIEIVRDFQKLQANSTGIGPAYNLKYLDALPWGTTLYGQAPRFGAGSCPRLAFVRDTLTGRVDTMSFLSFNLCPKLADISGFKYVKGVTDQLLLQDLQAGSFTGLENLQWSRWIGISTGTFPDLQFLSHLDSVGVFDISGNIAGLQGLENLRTVDYLSIFNNPIIQDLSPVEDVTRIQQSLGISYLTNLDSITGFNLPQLMGPNNADNLGINIEDCAQLKSVSGFNGLTVFTHAISPQPYNNVAIVNNPLLQSVTGFQNLSYLKKGLNISNNPVLSDISGFCHLFQTGAILGIKTIQNNALGANSYPEALALCPVSDSREPEADMQLSVYPNPATEQFAVAIAGSAAGQVNRIVVADLAGKCLHSITADPEQTLIFCGDLPAGMYLVQAWSDGSGSRPVKLVIAKK